MKIAIFTQEAPFYLPELLLAFLQRQTGINFEVFCFENYQKSVWHEIKNRYEYYGLINFIRFVVIFLKKKTEEILKIKVCSVKNICIKINIPYEKVKNINAASFTDFIHNSNYALIISIACPKIIRREIIDSPLIGCLNYHTALLPKNRGRQPLFWAMLNGEKEAGVTIHWMDEKIDNGPILCQKKFSLEGVRSLDVAYRKSIKVGLNALNDAVELIKNNNFVKIPNDITMATYQGFPDKKSSARFRAKGYRFF